LDRLLGDEQRGRDLGIGPARGDLLDGLEFARRERGQRTGIAARSLGPAHRLLDQPPGDRRRQQRLPRHRQSHRAEQFFGGRVRATPALGPAVDGTPGRGAPALVGPRAPPGAAPCTALSSRAPARAGGVCPISAGTATIIALAYAAGSLVGTGTGTLPAPGPSP